MAKSAPSESGIIQSVDRALRILRLFHQNKNTELSIREIAGQLELNKSTAFCLLQTLKRQNFIRQNEGNSKYSLGLGLMEIGLSMAAGLEVGPIARPLLEELVKDRSETAHLVVQDGDQVIYIEKIAGTKTSSVGIVSYVGKSNPMYCTGVGKCVLAWSSEETINRVLSSKLVKFTKNTVIDAAALRQELSLIRKKGFAIDREEIEIGLKCVAAPIFDCHGQVTAAISLSGPSSHLPEEKLVELVGPVTDCARQISAQLGFPGQNR